MAQNNDFKLDLLSKIDEKLVDKVTLLRAKLTRKPRMKRKTLWTVTSIAASFLLIAGTLLALLPMLLKQVPVYTGMTVSNKSPFEVAYAGDAQYEQLAATGKFEGDHDGKEKKPSKNPSLRDEVEDTLKVEGAAETLYYANPKEDIYITVHINNPDKYEILSFTLNGEKYSSYMFEDGSDMENLVLKVNVGDVEGIVEYTIDAIKYVDGTQIKDVKMEGDQTVKVGVYPKEQPTAEVGSEQADLFSLSYQVTVTDGLSLIKNCNGSVYALLMDGEEIVAKESIEVGKAHRVTFDGLEQDKQYDFVVVAFYDALDGQGFVAHILAEDEIRTENVLDLTNVSVAKDGSVSFDLAEVPGYDVLVEKIELVSSDGTVVETQSGSARSFDSKLYIGTYTIDVTYTHTVDGKQYSGVKKSDALVRTYVTVSQVMANGEISKPCSFDTQVFNESTSSFRVHTGMDITPAKGLEGDKKVYSASFGTVKKVYNDPALGWTIIVGTADGLVIRYCGFAENSIAVEEGDQIVGGTVLGIASSAGGTLEFKEPDHIHIEISKNGLMVDPIQYIVGSVKY